MNRRIPKSPKIPSNVQDRNSEAWRKLCEYVELVAADGAEEFFPYQFLGNELYSQIHTLPESIGKLKQVKRVILYGSSLKRIPPEIGEMESLEEFDPYTSYDLHWFPYELTKCKNLKDSRVSTRALFGNYKNRMPFPRLDHNPVRYEGDTVKCSVCGRSITYAETNQMWITLWVGTDALPLLANLCSTDCEVALPKPPDGYYPLPHKGGFKVPQPHADEWEPYEEMAPENQAFASNEEAIAESPKEPESQQTESNPEQPKTVSWFQRLWGKKKL